MAAHDETTIKANWKCFLACGIMILSPFQYGVDFGLIGGVQAMQGFLQIFGYFDTKLNKWNIDPKVQQLITSLMTLGAFAGSITAGFIAAKLGRKMCLWLACLICCVSNIIMMVTLNVNALYIGRLLNGIANGYFMTFSQLYIQESSPAKYRALLLTFFNFSVSFGTLLGTIGDWATAQRPNRSAYLIPLGIIYIVPVIITISMLFIPESPRWLIMQGRNEEGRKSLIWLRPKNENVELEIVEIEQAIQQEKDIAGGIGFFDMFRDPIDRRRTFLSVSSVTLQAASGSMFIISYKAYFFTMANVTNPFGMSCVLSAVGLTALTLNSLIVVKYGRRRVLLMCGFAACGILQLIIAIVYSKQPGTQTTGKVIVALSSIYMFSYNGAISTYAWVSGGELPSQRLRSHTFGLAAASGFFFAWLTAFTAPYFINPASLGWGPRYGYIWAPSCLVAFLWVYFFLPEVKGRTLEEIDEMFQARLGARKFRKFACRGPLASESKEKEATVLEVETGSKEEKV